MQQNVIKALKTDHIKGPNYYRYLGVERLSPKKNCIRAYKRVKKSLTISHNNSKDFPDEEFERMMENLDEAFMMIMEHKEEIDTEIHDRVINRINNVKLKRYFK